jgi:hypothetical protein
MAVFAGTRDSFARAQQTLKELCGWNLDDESFVVSPMPRPGEPRTAVIGAPTMNALPRLPERSKSPSMPAR